MERTAKILFGAGVLFCLLQVWLPGYFLTGDGPCHVYNAKVLHDLWAGHDVEFYKRFYSLSTGPNPNWLSHIVLASLMFVVNGIVAEKLIVSAYILLFITGFAALLKRIGGGNPFLLLIPFLFVINYILVKGFYNFSLSIGIFFWLTEMWLRYLVLRKWPLLLLCFVLASLTFFTHPLAFAFGGLLCFMLTLSTVAAAQQLTTRDRLRNILRGCAAQFLCFLPGMILFLKFTTAEGGLSGLHLYMERYRLADLLHNNYMIGYSTGEAGIAHGLAWLFAILFGLSMAARLRTGIRIQAFDGLIITCAAAGYIYLRFPDNLLGGGAFSVRAQYFLFLLGVCCMAWLLPWRQLKTWFGIASFACFIVLSIVRLPCALAASRAGADIMSAASHIRPNSVVLPLDFSPNGKDVNGRIIADGNWLFTHAAEYVGIKKPVIMLDNYEANAGYFPLLWKQAVNPYLSLGMHEEIGKPPYADIAQYEKTSGVRIDYILMWCYDTSAINNEYFRNMYSLIDSSYNMVFASATGRTRLYELKQ